MFYFMNKYWSDLMEMDNCLLIEIFDELIDCWSIGKVLGYLLKY